MKYWIVVDETNDAFDCDNCNAMVHRPTYFCPRCGDKKEIVALTKKDISIKQYWKNYDYKYYCMLGLNDDTNS